MNTLRKELAGRLHGLRPDRVVFVGVGNRFRADDGIGPAMVDLLKGRVVHAIDADSAPENVTSAVRQLKPSAIVFLDAASFGDAAPGFTRIVEPGDVEKLEATAHNFSLDVVMEYLKESTGADVFLVGVQPEKIAEGESLSPSLIKPLKIITDDLVDAIKKD